ncbi:Immunoglobulin E-set [Arabidopsis suecica]|uniref:Immunoglobulin E-set n=1 Tax=Arabidopsis suecica TaxID=45249 RepID=A0A8T2B984_ARASU|nr:Immunoglobulin E-set [Arabidopsis suecica]
MAIFHAKPLLLLLISLFFFFAVGDTDFQTCNTGHNYPVKVSDLKISPNPVKRSGSATITITGYTSKDIPDGVTVTLKLSIMGAPVSRKTYSLCDITACPVAPGPLVLTLPNVLTESERRRSRGYISTISITEKGQESLMCVVFGVKIRGYASLLSQVTGW